MPLAPLLLLAAAPVLCLAGSVAALVLSARPSAARLVAGLAALAAAVMGFNLALPVLLGAPSYGVTLGGPVPGLEVGLRVDGLSAWFILLLSAVALPVVLAGLAYARVYDQHGGPRLAAATNVFLAAMLLVLLADGIYGFLLGWELMAVASYLLVVHEHAAPGVRRDGFVYLGMTHLGAAFLLVALLLLRTSGGAWDFAGLRQAALEPGLRDLVFILALVGCGTKAGVIPFHVWLPRAHPVAPSHISALMSGVMLKVGIYGLLRIAWDLLGGGPAWWGGLVLVLGLVSAVLGVLYALMEHDLKRLLAFHSVENVGIVLIGVGTGQLLAALGHPAAAALALGAGLFHALNHALFKALLFLGAGAVHQATGTRDLEKLGGLVRRMPQTAALFLVGSAAISALPPLNGFASEWLTFQSLLALGQAAGASLAVAAALAAALLGLTGALAAACFVKAFGVAFLALPRSEEAARAREAPSALLSGMAILALACVLLGLLPGLATALLAVPTAELAGVAMSTQAPVVLATPAAGLVPLALLGALAAAAGLTLLVTQLLGGRRAARVVPTWACGYALTPRMQYGSTAFAKPIRLFFRAIVRPERAVEAEYHLAPYFPARLRTHGALDPVFEQRLYGPLAAGLLHASSLARTLQSGSLRLYLAYILATLVALLVATR
jgi:hydrogenase-4 component B